MISARGAKRHYCHVASIRLYLGRLFAELHCTANGRKSAGSSRSRWDRDQARLAPNPALAPGETEGLRRVENNVLVSARYGRPRARVDALPDAQGVSDPSRSKEVATAEIVDC